MKWQFIIWLDDLPQPITNTNASRFCSLPAKSSGQCVSACFQLRKKSLSHPHTAMNVAQGTRMSGRSRRPRGYVYLTLSNITDGLAPNHLGYFSPTLFPLSVGVMIILLCLTFLSDPRWGLMFHPGVTGSCGNHTQKHTLSATPMVRWVIQHAFVSVWCSRRPL